MSKRLRYVIETLLVNAMVLSSLYHLLVYLANRRFWRQSTLPPSDAAPPSISVVVPLRGKTLDTFALLNLMAVSGPTNEYEVILVLESDSDPAYGVAQRVVESYPDRVRIVVSGPAGDHVGKIHNLNTGYMAARGDLIALVDATVSMHAELWHAALAVMDDPTVGAAFAPPLYAEPEHRAGLPGMPVATGGEMLTTLYVNHARTAGMPFAALSNRIKALRGGFMVFRRDALVQAGGMLHLLDEAADDVSLGRLVRENGYRLTALPVPARIIPIPETVSEATHHLLRSLMIHRAYHLLDFLAWPFTNPLTVGFMLGLITEREGRWWGRRTWWGFAWFRLALAYELDRVRFGHAFQWTAYAQLFMLDTFIAPVLWARALVQNTFTWRGRTYHIVQGGKTTPIDVE